MFDTKKDLPQPALYRSSFEHDNCGIGAIVDMKGRKTHKTVSDALSIVENLEHRAGKDAEGKTGDGVGILLQISHKFFVKACKEAGIVLPKEREYGVGMFFFPQDELKRNQSKKMFEIIVEKEGLESLFYDIEMPLIYVLAEMEYTGVTLDTVALKQSSEELTTALKKLEKEIYELAGMKFNINSARQVGEVLFDHLKIEEKARKTKTGSYSTSEEILEKMRSKHPVVGKLLEYRGLKKLLSTYIDALPELINPETGKIHTSYNQAVTSTGRLSSTNPNLQNIPVRDELGREIRKAFTAENEDCIFFSADYSQIELRIMAHLSQDAHMIEAFRSGADIHAATAAKIYGIPVEEVTSDMRRKAKTANFGIIYGISVFGLAERLSIPRAESKELIEGYFKTYPDIRAYMDESIEVAKEKGYVETIYKRKRFLPDINSHNAIVRGYAERNAINAPIQGSAADIIKVAMVRIFNRFETEGLKSKMILQVHDELNFNVYKDELEKVKQIVLDEMENAIKLQVPLIADCGEGVNWLEAH